MNSRLLRFALVITLCAALPLAVIAKKRKHHPASHSFDYYLLALSWAPDFCDQHPDKRDTRECAPGTRSGFVVHGLWPQFESGLGPMSCDGPALDRESEQIALQFMPDAGLAQHE